MSSDFFIQSIIGGAVIGFCVLYALAATYDAGKRSERGGDKTTGVPGAVVTILVALGVAFSLGREAPYLELFGWLHDMMAMRPKLS